MFLAVELPQRHKLSIEKAIQKLRMELPEARWVPRENWHCTIKFLGHVADERLEEVQEIAADGSSRARIGYSRLTDVGAFPNRKRARVLWVGMTDPGNELSYLAARLEKKFGRSGLRQESRTLHPHITIARLKTPAPLEEVIERSGPYVLDQEPIPLFRLVLFESRLSGLGATYYPLAEFAFSSPPGS